MFYNFKKNTLLNYLLCNLVTVKAEDITIRKNCINFIIDDKSYTMVKPYKIRCEAGEKIDFVNFIKEDIEYNSKGEYLPIKDLELNKDYKITSFYHSATYKHEECDILAKLNDVEWENINKSLLNVFIDLIHKLPANSVLSDGKNIIDLSDVMFGFSDLSNIKTVADLIKFFEKICKDKTFGNDNEGFLKNKTIGDNTFENCYIKSCKIGCTHNVGISKDFMFYYELESIIKAIKEGTKIELTFGQYFNYEINNIDLSDELKKIKKPNKTSIDNFKINQKEVLYHNVNKLKYSDIETKIKSLDGFKNIEINKTDDSDIIPGPVNLEITKDIDDKFSEIRKGKIKFVVANGFKFTNESKCPETEVNFSFGDDNIVIKDANNLKLKVQTDTTADTVKKAIKNYLGNPNDTLFNVIVPDFSGDNPIIIVTINGAINNISEKTDENDIKITVKYEIEDNDAEYQFVDTFNSADVSFTLLKSTAYSDFITKLKSSHSDIEPAIKEIKNGDNIIWKDGGSRTNTIESMLSPGSKSIILTVILNKLENGNYVKKKVVEQPGDKNIQFNIKVTACSGYKLKNTTGKTIGITLDKTNLSYTTFFNAIKEQLSNNDKFNIKKGENIVKNTDTIDANDNNSYSIELHNNSGLVEKIQKEDSKQQGEETTQKDIKENKKVCSNKCYNSEKK